MLITSLQISPSSYILVNSSFLKIKKKPQKPKTPPQQKPKKTSEKNPCLALVDSLLMSYMILPDFKVKFNFLTPVIQILL